jgi:hypothetical protein
MTKKKPTKDLTIDDLCTELNRQERLINVLEARIVKLESRLAAIEAHKDAVCEDTLNFQRKAFANEVDVERRLQALEARPIVPAVVCPFGLEARQPWTLTCGSGTKEKK